jgi:hypothetical protein
MQICRFNILFSAHLVEDVILFIFKLSNFIFLIFELFQSPKLIKYVFLVTTIHWVCNYKNCAPRNSHVQEQEKLPFFNYYLFLVSKLKLPLYQKNGNLHLNTKAPSTLQRIFPYVLMVGNTLMKLVGARDLRPL